MGVHCSSPVAHLEVDTVHLKIGKVGVTHLDDRVGMVYLVLMGVAQC